jgi:hypothetical protein
MSDSERRAMDLAQKIVNAFQAVDQPTRNARSMITDAAVWTEVAKAIVDVVEGNDSIEVVEEIEEIEEEDQAEAEVEDIAELDQPKKRKGRK